MITGLYDVYREETDRQGIAVSPDHIGLRRNVAVSLHEDAAREESAQQIAKVETLLMQDDRYSKDATGILDAPAASSAFSVHEHEFIAGTPDQVAEQIIEQCRACGAGHFLALVDRGASQDGMIRLFCSVRE